MPVTVKKIGGRYRVIEADTGAIATNPSTGKPLDGDKHGGNAKKAKRQARAINMSLRQEGKI